MTTNHIHTYDDDGKESAVVTEGSRCDFGTCRERATHLAVVRILPVRMRSPQALDVRPVCDKHAEYWQDRPNVTLVAFRGESWSPTVRSNDQQQPA